MLNKIVEAKKKEVGKIVHHKSEAFVHRSLFHSLSQPKRDIGLIAEIKKASPSKGVIREPFHPLEIALDYMSERVDAISVLTDEQFFHGSKDYLTKIKRVVDVPILRKDFIIDEKQILESKLIGADAILLIGEILDPVQVKEFYMQAAELQLECLVEVHSIKTVEGILKEFTPKVIGINNRDLSSFHTNIQQTKTIIASLPKNSLVVSESGIHSHEDLQFIKSVGAKAILVGEAFMRETNPRNGIRKLFGEDHLV
ncbi:indole-3-glycerol phosphate synthase TrpC [Bacillus salitolerans]|uniref:indole-3-glycerol-phosphate synthase n=1 Tax=Bacillus salitolerans TaxID=1437434 RepID=A0ABW4LTT6_9BACI